MPTIEFRIDVTGIPHSFVILNNGAGFENGYGFAPAEGLSLFGNGWIHDDTNHAFDYSTGPISISSEQYNAIAEKINHDISNPPYYDLPGSIIFHNDVKQCAQWIADLARKGGVDLPFNMGNGGWNPYGQAILLGGSTTLTFDQVINSKYLTGRTLIERRDPLTLDLDNDGLETVGINTTTPILFDHDADGIKTATGWVKSDDAFLVLDRNGNGTIDSGRELFGDSTSLAAGGTAADGFAALAQEDSNGDGLVNTSDAHWSSLRLWRDLNQDGVSQADELFTLESQNIASLTVAKTENSKTLSNGNQIADLGSYTRTDGSTGELGEVSGMGDVNLASNPFYSDFTDPITLTDDARTLADMKGAGMVRDLREAASLDGALVSKVNAFAGLTRSQMMSQLDGLIRDWADTSTMQTSIETAEDKGFVLKYMAPGMSVNDVLRTMGLDGSGGGSGTVASLEEMQRLRTLQAQVAHINELIGVLERFNGVPFVTVEDKKVTTGQGAVFAEKTTSSGQAVMEGIRYVFVPLNSGQLSLLEQSYAQLKESVYGGLVMQTRLKPYMDAITLSIDENGIALDFSAMEATLDTLYSSDKVRAFIDVLDLNSFGQALGWNSAQKLVDWASEANASGQLEALKVGLATAFTGGLGKKPNIKFGTAGNETLSGDTSIDIIVAGAGNDRLLGGDGIDVLDGGSGNDSLSGGNGADTYLFGIGSGQDTISNSDSDALGTNADTIQFGAGVTIDNVVLTRSSTSLIIALAGTSDKLTVSSYFNSDGTTAYAVENLKFADGTVWDIATVKAKVMLATAGNDSLYGYATADTLVAGDGNDTLYGYGGNDILDGGNGTDSLYGDSGDDVLQGGDGNDTLTDASGKALFDGGSGTDTLTGGSSAELYLGGLGNDTLTTGAGNDVILFNKGDGQDTFAAGGTGSDTLSLGGDFAYSDLSFSKSSNNLVLKMGASDQITFKNWYATTPSKPVVNLQVIAEAMADFDAGGSNPLLDQKVENFNFSGLVGAFDAARTTDTTLTAWALSNALSNCQLDGSDGAALGGDLAYQYGKNGTLAGIGLTAAQGVLGDASFGSGAQTLQPLASLQTGSVRLS